MRFRSVGLAVLDAAEQVVQAHVALGLLGGQAGAQRALLGQLAGIALVLEHAELVAGGGHRVQAQDLHRVGGLRLGDVLAARVHQSAHAAVGRAGHHDVAGVQGAALDEHRGHGAPALVQVRLDDEAGGRSVGVGLQLQHVGLQDDGLQQVVDVQLLLGRHLDEHVGAAPLLGDDAVLGELLAHAVGVGAGLVDLVHGHDDGHLGGLGVVDGLDGLRHDAVVGGHHEHDDVGDLGAAGAHGGEGLVARGVDEGDLAVADVHHRRADVLGDAAGLAGHHAGVADGVQKRGLAVVDMAHDGDHGGTRLQIGLGVVVHHGVLLLRRHDAHLAAHVVGDELHGLVAHGLGEREHLAEHEQALDDVVGLHAQKLGELGHRRALRDLHHGVVQHQRRVETALDGLQLGALAGLGLALLLALLAAALPLVGVGRGHGGAGLGEHLVALQLLGLHGHLGVAVLAGGHLGLELGHHLVSPALLALLAAAASRRGVGLGALGRLHALLLGLDLREQRVEVVLGARRRGSRGRTGRGRRGRGLRGLLVAAAQGLFHGALLGHLGGRLLGAGAGPGLLALALDALLL